MRFENTRTARPERFVHRAGYYSSSDDLVSVAEPIVREALAQSQPVALIACAYTERRLRNVLGEDVSGLIHLPPAAPELRGSGQTVVTRRARELRDLTDWAGEVTVVAEHHPHRPGVHPSAWVEADAAMNIALASLPIRLTCLFPTDLVQDTVAAAVRWNHPHLLGADGSVRPNPDVRPPAEALAMHPVAAPAPLGAPDRELTFTPWQLIELRAEVAKATEACGLSRERAEDFVLAVNEVASNAAEHGYGVGELRMWLRPNRLVCEVHDKGVLREPLPGLRPPHPSAARGRGMWIARQFCDLLHVWTDAHGTHVRLEASAS